MHLNLTDITSLWSDNVD